MVTIEPLPYDGIYRLNDIPISLYSYYLLTWPIVNMIKNVEVWTNDPIYIKRKTCTMISIPDALKMLTKHAEA